MNILVLGSGGREHALAWALAKSPRTTELYVAPGNGGTAHVATNITGLDINNGEAVLGFARDHAIDLVVIVLLMYCARRTLWCLALMPKALSSKALKPTPNSLW